MKEDKRPKLNNHENCNIAYDNNKLANESHNNSMRAICHTQSGYTILGLWNLALASFQLTHGREAQATHRIRQADRGTTQKDRM